MDKLESNAFEGFIDKMCAKIWKYEIALSPFTVSKMLSKGIWNISGLTLSQDAISME